MNLLNRRSVAIDVRTSGHRLTTIAFPSLIMAGFNRRLSVSDIGLRGDVPLSPTRSASTPIQMSMSLRWTSAPVARTRPRFGLLGE